ncbi:MAG: hypothetical protein PHY34_02605 [Patescibacteria group bacterium]|nr:hypothetical protein [Patescibacteria group bacterium]MDD5715465.1 hypothetical protein [Patescibacteria group bacterium]
MDQEQKRKNFIIILIALGAVLVIAFFVWWQFFRDGDTPTNNTAPVTNTNGAVPVVNSTVNTAVPGQNTNADPEELTLVRLANFFTERYGSYSSEAKYQNILDLRPYMTATMQSVSEDFIRVQLARGETAFASVFTKVVSTKDVEIAGTRANVVLSTQRAEQGTAKGTYYQDIELQFLKEGNSWLVDEATWGSEGITPAAPSANTNSTNTNININDLLPSQGHE